MRTVALCLAGALLGCHVHGDPPPVTPAATELPASNWNFVLGPARGARALVALGGRDDAYVARYFVGGSRVEIDGAGAHVARDEVAGGLLGGTETSDGWLFVGRDADIYRADEFIGSLAQAGRVTAELVELYSAERGTLAVGDAQGRLWTITNDGATIIEIPTGEPVYDAHVDWRGRGLVAVSPGRLFTFTRGDTRGRAHGELDDAVMRVDGNGVTTVWGHYGLVRGNLVRQPVTPAPRGPGVAPLLDVGVAHLLDIEVLPVTTAPVHGDGRILCHRSFADEAWVGSADGWRQITAADDCVLYAWGTELLETCHAGDRRTFSAGDGQRWRSLESIGKPSARESMRVFPSLDGESLLVAHACEAEDEASRGHTAYCLYDGAKWRPRVLPDTQFRVQALAGTRVLLGRGQNVELHDLADPRPTQVELAAGTGGRDAQLLADGTLVWVRRAETPEAAVVIERARAEPVVRPLPPAEVPRVAFADALHGVVLETAPGHAGIWVTSDGAESWQRIEAPGANDERMTGRAPPYCSLHVCVIGSFWWGDEQSLRGVGEHRRALVGPRPRASPPPSSATPEPEPRWRCTVDGPIPPREDERDDVAVSISGRVDWHVTNGDLAWQARGRDARGAFGLRGRVRGGDELETLLRDYASGWASGWYSLLPIVTRELVVITTGVDRLDVLGPSGRQSIELLAGMQPATWLELAGGGLALWSTTHDAGVELVELGARGTRVRRRGYRFAGGSEQLGSSAHAAVTPSGPGMARMLEPGRYRFYPIDPGAAPVDVEFPPRARDRSEALPICADTGDPDAFVASWWLANGAALPDDGPPGMYAIVEVGERGSCVRQLRARVGLTLFARGGKLEGAYQSAAGPRVTCEPRVDARGE